MASSVDEREPLEIDGREPLLKRLFFLGAGLLCIVAPTWDFRQVFLEPGWWSLFFGAILAGAYAVGGAFLPRIAFRLRTDPRSATMRGKRVSGSARDRP